MTHRLLSLVQRGAASAGDDHERAFLSRYGSLRAYAGRLVGHDRSLADDLIQDAYIQFALTRPELEAIVSLDAYLTALVRNLHVSWIRRTATQRARHIAIEDYESADLALALSGPQQRDEIRSSLIRVCEYGCVRKERSKAASVLLLRFFHGFYPAEIARILRSTPRVVNDWLWRARAEARRFVDAPASERRPDSTTPLDLSTAIDDDAVDVIAALQAAIFATAQPPCPAAKAIVRWYDGDDGTALDVARFAHLASCRPCLNLVCRRLGLASVEERAAGEGSSGPPDGRGGSTSGGSFERRARRRARDVREHRPRQLQISVNGYEVGTLGVEAARNEVRWTVRLDEPIAFIEAHSEQGLRLALLHVERPPTADLVQSVHVALSDDRSLRLILDFSGVHPAVTVHYADPSLTPSAITPIEASVAGRPEAPALFASAGATTNRWAWTWLTGWPRGPRRFAPVGVTLLLLATAAWWLVAPQPDRTGPTELIARAVSREAAAVPTSAAVHRTLRFEAHSSGSGTALFSHRVESWSRADTSARAIRVFDAADHMIAGRWIVDGRDRSVVLGLLDDVWTAELSAATFRDRYLSLGSCLTAEDARFVTLTCEQSTDRSLWQALAPEVHAQTTAVATPVSRASLVLRRADLHAVRLVLTVRLPGADGGSRIVTLEERASIHVPVTEIPADVFTPDVREVAATLPVRGPAAARRAVPLTPSLELQVLELVARHAAGEYLSVDRVDRTRLSLTGLVSTATQKAALLAAIRRLDAGDTVVADVRTFAEAARHDRQAPGDRDDRRRRLRLFESAPTTAPIDDYMQSRVAGGVDAVAIIREMAPRVLASSERLRQHALALQAIVDRFDDTALASLDEPGEHAWHALLRRHVDECLAALEVLDTTLAPYFDAATAPLIAVPDTVRATSRRLANETTTIDDAVKAAFLASDAVAAPPQPALDVRQHISRARLDARHLRGLTSP